MNDELTRYIEGRWGVASRLELEFENAGMVTVIADVEDFARNAAQRFEFHQSGLSLLATLRALMSASERTA